jgi:hypothetical protein
VAGASHSSLFSAAGAVTPKEASLVLCNYAASSAEDIIKERNFGRPIRLYQKMEVNKRVWKGSTSKQSYGVLKFEANSCGHCTV